MTCIVFGHIALQPYQGFFGVVSANITYYILISENVLQIDARKINGNDLETRCVKCTDL